MPTTSRRGDVREVAFGDGAQGLALEVEDGPARAPVRPGRRAPAGSVPRWRSPWIRWSGPALVPSSRPRSALRAARRARRLAGLGPGLADALGYSGRDVLPRRRFGGGSQGSASRRCTVAVAAPSAWASAANPFPGWPRPRRAATRRARRRGIRAPRRVRRAGRTRPASGVRLPAASHSPATQPRVAGTSAVRPAVRAAPISTSGFCPSDSTRKNFTMAPAAVLVVDDHRTVRLLAGEHLHVACGERQAVAGLHQVAGGVARRRRRAVAA